MEGYVDIGVLQKSYGTTGQIRAHLDVDLKDLPEYIFLNLEGAFVPFGIEHVDAKKNLLKLEWLNNPEVVDKIMPSKVYLARNDMMASLEQSEHVLLSALKNYVLTDKDNMNIGIIKSIEQYPSQLMLVIQREEEEHLLPFHEDLIIEMDHFSRVLKYNLPEGILTLNN